MHLDINVHHYFHNDTDDRILSAVGLVQVSVDALGKQGNEIMATVQQLTDAMSNLQTAIPVYIAARDAIDKTKDAAIADLTARLAADEITVSQFQSSLDPILANAQADLIALTPPAAGATGATGATGSTGATGATSGATGSTGTTGGTGGPVGGVTPV